MKASEAKLLDFLEKSKQFVIPIYQRTYSWTERECSQLLEDILRAGRNEAIPGHFIGSIVYIEQGLSQVSRQSPLLVIDGQQRLTTVSLIIEALARQVADTEPLDGFSAKKLRSYYLLNPLEEGERGYKLLLTQTDKQTLLAIVDQKTIPDEHSLRIKENFAYFEKQVRELGRNLKPLCKGLAKLMVVDIALSRDHDNPQLIFESMNSTGRELSQADLIRNFILMGLEPKQQNRLYDEHWHHMEVAFGQEAYAQHFDGFMRHYLTVKTGDIPNIRKVYEAFKLYSRRRDVDAAGTDALVADVHTFAGYYCCMALGQEPEPNLKAAFDDLRELKANVAYPFLLKLYADYTKDILSALDLEHAVRLVESYVFRRAVCAIPTNSLNKTFRYLGEALDEKRYLESIQAQFMLMPSYRRFPKNDEFHREIKVRNLYHFGNRSSYWLRRLENYGRKEGVLVDEYTIEHIIPQNKKLSPKWRSELGAEWQRVHETWLHTLGNLTLTGYNAEYSDRTFAEKRDMKGGFRESPLRVNEGLGTVETWNEKEIKARADRLAHKALSIWTAPSLSEEILDTHRLDTTEKPDAYAIEDHKFLNGGPIRLLFDAFRKEVLALDPCVTEEFLKLYVAYKAETNFVDVVPQARGLRLSVNLKFHELHDPRWLAKDVTNVGRWGNGDVEVVVSKPEELPYVMSLVRQAFDKQMGDGESAV